MKNPQRSHRRSATAPPPVLLGIEAGGTRTVAILADAAGRELQHAEAGPANLRLLSDAELARHLAGLARQFPPPAAVGIGMAGAREESDRRRIRAAAGHAWPRTPCWVGNDLDTALAAAGGAPEGDLAARVIVISGTGSCCFGKNRRGASAKVGGWGHWLGDRGSGFDIALNACRRVVEAFDVTGRWPALGSRLLRALALNEPNELVTWVHAAGKAEIARLAVELFAAAAAGDRLARAVLGQAADSLATEAVACARRLARDDQRVEFVFCGGTLLKQRRFAAEVTRRVLRARPPSRVRLQDRAGVWGAIAFAGQALELAPPAAARRLSRAAPTATARLDLLPQATGPSPTEARNPRSRHLDRLPVSRAIRLMLAEDARLPAAVQAEARPIARTIGLVVAAFRRGGRLFYVGAGTSGRLGVLDASECPPTFSVPAHQVQGIIAGGAPALWSSMEGAEDDAAAGAEAVRYRGVTKRDVVLGIAASGRTPFVWGALTAARRLGARTVLLSFNPNLRFTRAGRPDVVITPAVGPEVLTGSTRLKAGTATKLVLNLITTLAMVRLGKVVENLMVDVRPSNAKLRDRAIRIVQALTEATPESARAALESSGWIVKRALARLPRPRA